MDLLLSNKNTANDKVVRQNIKYESNNDNINNNDFFDEQNKVINVNNNNYKISSSSSNNNNNEKLNNIYENDENKTNNNNINKNNAAVNKIIEILNNNDNKTTESINEKNSRIEKILITKTRINNDLPFQFTKLNTKKLDFIEKILCNEKNEFSNSLINREIEFFQFKFLANTQWLSCSIIDFYTTILSKKFEDTHYYFSVLFMEKLYIEGKGNYNYENVRRWNKSKSGIATLNAPKINIFEKKLLFFPMNYPSNIHFFLFVVNLEYKMIFYFNSLNNKSGSYCSIFSEQIKRYLNDESKQFEIKDFNCTNYEVINMDNFNCPKQMDGYNCGVFTIMFMEFISHGIDYKLVNHNYMDHFRSYIAITLKQGIYYI